MVYDESERQKKHYITIYRCVGELFIVHLN